jgi:hypothetical protein
MNEKLSTGDHVTWNDPQYEVRGSKSGRTAVHKPDALEHETGERT